MWTKYGWQAEHRTNKNDEQFNRRHVYLEYIRTGSLSGVSIIEPTDLTIEPLPQVDLKE